MWNAASEDWHTTWAENDLQLMENCFRMEAKDGSAGFDFRGKYEEVQANEQITYTTDDGKSKFFTKMECKTRVVQLFEAETENQLNYKEGWQAILNNFKNYVEQHLQEISFQNGKFKNYTLFMV
jgi:uncharacterized protein YndB with AHSA1/START domain